MRPRELILEAFGPFSGKEIINFDSLNRGLYLITGDTGSGKTTIFDGITFALYGEPSGNNRRSTMLRSDFAGERDITKVTYTFEYGPKQYKVWRTPQYERAKQRGSGTITQSKDAALYDLSRPENEQVIATGTTGVTEKITEIIGISREQFINVSMIAQGEFLKLLLAKSSDRAEIFRNIFKTQVYEGLEKELKARTRELDGKRNLKKQSLIQYAAGVQGQLREEYISCIKDSNVYFIPEFIDNLVLGISRDENTLKRISGEKEKYRKSYDEALGQLSGEKEKERARKESEERLKNTKKELTELESRLKMARETLKRAEEKRESIDILKENAIRIKDTFTLYLELDNLEQELSEKNGNIRRLEKEIEDNAEKATDLEKRTAEINNKHNLDMEEYNRLEEKKNQAALVYERMSDEYLRNQAGILASGLKDGSPCPVCGSTKHPRKQPLCQEVCSGDELKKLKKERDEFREKQEKLSLLLGKASELIKTEEEKVHSLKEKGRELGIKKQELEVQKAGLKERIQEKRIKLAYPDLSHARLQYEKCMNEIENIEVQISTAKEEVDSLVVREETGRLFIKREEAFLNTQDKQQDISKLEEKIQEGSEAIRDIEKQEKLIELCLDKNRTAMEAIKKEYRDYTRITDEWKLYDSLSQTAGGMGYSRGKFNFESYVQARYFEQIIELANVRLGKMTDGRFVLLRRREAVSKASHTGLEIDVLDNNTGKVRRGETLSGGEAFMASLSMALGMSDVIASSSGGIRLDSMFIDEGFGSLDSNSLEKALEILDDLSLGGSRSIGIISHVEALKDRIDNKIIVQRDIHGSHLHVSSGAERGRVICK
mgnify:CR=1 FL=1